MFETLKPLYPEGSTNRTDPIVRHESKYSGGIIATLYRPQHDTESRGLPNTPMDAVQRDGVHYPLIRVNNHLILEDWIEHFTLYNDRFTPYINLSFFDGSGNIQLSDMPGLNNVVTVFMMENDKNAHRCIKMDFYITECNIYGNTFNIWAEFKCLPLEKQQLKQEVFHYPGEGCKCKWCNLPPNFHPTTYEFLHVVAEQCGLGFSATQRCKDINDDRYRILKKEKYKDAVIEHTACGGLDENSIFDSWIDPWGMLVMVNLPWIMHEEVQPDELASIVTVAVETAEAGSEGAKVSPGMTHRILSNVSEVSSLHNMIIKSLEKTVDLASGYYEGTLTEYNTITPEGCGDGKNTLKTIQVQQSEDSLTGKKYQDSFEFQNQEFAGFEMSTMTPTINQRRIHDIYFRQQRAHMFKATLQQPNFGLERGMLVMILWCLDDAVQKATSLNQSPNLTTEDTSDAGQIRQNSADDEAIGDIRKPIIDESLSGFYYIDGTDWEYDGNNGEKIQQHLYLIKKGPITQYYDNTGLTRFNANGK